MSARQAMKHRATIERRQDGVDDAHGHTTTTGYATHLSDLPCYAWFKNGRLVRDGDKVTRDAGWQMLVPRDTDIDPLTDRVASVQTKTGLPVVSAPVRIEEVGRRFDHMVVIMERIG